MAEVRDRNFNPGETVETDETTFIGCNFDSTTLKYSGGQLPSFDQCGFRDVGWYFSDAALRTIQLLQQINNSGGGSGSEMIADLFKPGNLIGD
jgi:hypothetical protein